RDVQDDEPGGTRARAGVRGPEARQRPRGAASPNDRRRLRPTLEAGRAGRAQSLVAQSRSRWGLPRLLLQSDARPMGGDDRAARGDQPAASLLPSPKTSEGAGDARSALRRTERHWDARAEATLRPCYR